MIFRQLHDSVSSTYTYLLADPSTKDAVLIDSVFEQHARDAALIRELRLNLRYTLETHVHADHVTGGWLMKQAFGSQMVISERSGAECADVHVREGDVVTFGQQSLSVLATPGHTDGCVTYVTSERAIAFTGDCLMIRGAGRTDFQQGDAAVMFHSIRDKIFALPDACLLYPAHDYQGRTVTTVSEERLHNPRVGGDADEGDFVGYMTNLGLPHPKKIDVAVPANLACGRPEDGRVPPPATWGPVVQTYGGILEVDPEWVARHRDRVHVLDVRQPEELSDPSLGQIAGAQNIPIDSLRDRLDDVPKDRPVVTVCRSGRRSAQATVILREAGFEDVGNLPGGMLRWRQLSLPAV